MSDEHQSAWQRTPAQGLLRNRKSGRYYGRWTITVNGKSKQIWRALDTDVFSVAKLRLADEAAKIDQLRTSRAAVAAGAGDMADLFRVYEERLSVETTRDGAPLKSASITARKVALQKVRKTWPELATMKP